MNAEGVLLQAHPDLRMQEAKAGKLAALDAVWAAYQGLGQP
jgi:hypothetical protein